MNTEYMFLHSEEIDRKKWDETIANDPMSTAYVYSWYLDAVADQWGAIVSKDYGTIFPLAYKEKLGIKYFYQPFFTRCFGIFGSKLNTALLLNLLNDLSNKFKFWEINIEHISQPEIINAEITSLKFQLLDLKPSYLELYNAYSSKLKRSLRSALSENNTIAPSKDFHQFKYEFKNHTSSKIKEFRNQDYERLQKVLENCHGNATTWFYTVQKGEAILASAFFVCTGKRFIYIEGYSSPAGRKSQSMHLLFNHFISEHAGKELLLDFGGSNIPSIAHFFHCFVAKDHSFYHFKMNALPSAVRWLKK